MSDTINETNTSTPLPKKEVKPFSPFLIITFLLTLIALLISAYAVSKLNRIQDDALSAINAAEEQQTHRIQKTVSQFKSQMHRFQKERGELTKQIAAIARKQNQGEEGWQLIKAQHLVEIAGLSLYWEKTVHPALGLLEAADTLIQKLNDPTYTPLRQVLSDEILALKAVPQIDTIGLLSKLDALSNNISTLPLNTDITTDLTQKPIDTTDSTESSWRQTLDNSLKTISKLVVIRYRKESISPLLSPKERQTLLDQIKLALQQAEWAVIQKDKGLYTLSLNEATKLIKAHFKDEDKAVNTLLDTLSMLKKEDISPTLPDISRSKLMLDTLLKKNKGVSA